MSNVLQKNRRTAGKSWIELTDPLHGLTIQGVKGIYDQARRYGSPRLQKIYDEVESTDPVLMTCVQRRQSALSGLGWQVKVRASEDSAIAEAQREAVDKFLAGIDNFTDALCHLDLAFFRGFAHAQPIWNDNAVRHINLLDNWNFLQDDLGNWLWNPTCSITPAACEPITPAARLLSVSVRRPIDWPALVVSIRKSVGERDWGRFIERYGIPPVDVIMAPNATVEQRAEYLTSAESAREGLPTAWPASSQVSRAEGARGQDPFTAFVEHQDRLTVLMATGGTLTSLAQADTGTLAGGAQMDVWREIVLRDSLVIADAVERALVRPFVEAAFPGQPFAVSFELGVDRKLNSREAAELAGAIRSAGYVVDKAELEQATGFSLTKEEATAAALPTFGMPTAPTAPAEDVAATALNGAQVTSMVTLLQQASQGAIPKESIMPILKAAFPNVAEATLAEIVGPLESFSAAEAIARARASEGKGPAASAAPDDSLLSAFKDDSSPLATAIQDLLNDPSKEAADALIKRLPDLLPEDPALAAVIAEEMAKQFAK